MSEPGSSNGHRRAASQDGALQTRTVESSVPEQDLDAVAPFFASYLDIIRRRWRISLLVALAIFALSTFISLGQRKIYDASTKLVVVTKSAGAGGGGSGEGSDILSTLGSLKEGRNVDTQVEIIDSPDVIEPAFKRLPEKDRAIGFRQTFAPSWSYDIKSKQDTDVIIIATKAYDPKVAAEFANAIANTYLDDDLRRNGQATRQAAGFVQNAMATTDKDLQVASKGLARYQRETRLISAPDQVGAIATNEIEIQSDLDNAKGDEKAASSNLAAIEAQIKKTAPQIDYRKDIAENPEVTLVRAGIVTLEGQLTAAVQEFAAGAPEITVLKDQLAQEKKKLSQLTVEAVSLKETEANPVRLQLLTSYSTALSDSIVAQAHVSALSSQLSGVQTKLDEYPEQIRKLAEYQQRVTVLTRTYNMLSDRYYTLLIEEQSSLPNGLIAAFARPASVASSPKVPLSIAVGLILAVMAALGVAALLEKLDTKIHLPEDIERIARLPVLSLIPEASSTATRMIIGEAAPVHAFLEGFRLLRSNVAFAPSETQAKLLAVTSSAKGEGKSTIALNLAIALAMDGKRVLIIDTDLRRPSVHKSVGIENIAGFTSVVRGVHTLEKAARPTQWEGLDVLPSGPLPPDPTEFLNSKRSKEIFAQVADMYDTVILDAPPCAGLSDMTVISTIAEGVIFVSTLDSTSRPMLYSAMRMLRQAEAPLLGVVINRMKDSNRGYYGYYSYYGYYGYYGYSSYEDDGPETGKKKKKVKRKKESSKTQ